MKKIDIKAFIDERIGGKKELSYSELKSLIEFTDEPSVSFIVPLEYNSNALCMIVYYRLSHGIDWMTTLSNLYGYSVNPKESKERILSLLDLMEIDYDRDKAMQIMEKRIVNGSWESLAETYREIHPEAFIRK